MTKAAELDAYNPFDLLDGEAARLDAYFSSLEDADWQRPSRCVGWSVRDVLGHLAGEELYNQACLDDDIVGAFARLQSQGIQGLANFNEWGVRNRRPLPISEVLEEWREKNGDTRRRMRALGRDAMLPTVVGPYPVGLQTFHYASEYATHGDDIAVPVPADEAEARTRWRAAVGRFVLAEQERPVDVSPTTSGFDVQLDSLRAQLSASDFVEATVDRLPENHPLDARLADALACLA